MGRTEIHVHGYLELIEGVSRPQVESALHPLLEYLDTEQLSEISSLEPDQPGFAFHASNWSLEMCCTLEVENRFYAAFEASMNALGPLVVKAAPIEVSTYHEDGRDELQLVFVGPDPLAILDAQRREMLSDVEHVLSRHFGRPETEEVLGVVNNLFERQGLAMQSDAKLMKPIALDRRRLH